MSEGRAAQFVILGNPEGKRVALFQDALARTGRPVAKLVAWADAIRGTVDWARELNGGSAVLRIESPGQNFAVTKAILESGCDVADAEHPNAKRLSRADVSDLVEDRGLICCPRQWYLGFREVLLRLEGEWSACPPHSQTHTASSILMMFDKIACQKRLGEHGLPIPRSLGAVNSFDELLSRMRDAGIARVFVKLANGSSASGVVAYEQSGSKMLATTTAHIVTDAKGEATLYNSRTIRRYTRVEEIKRLIDVLAGERVQVEAWIPKAQLGDCAFDLRVLVIGSRARHTVVRMSKSPMTNLHLKNPRGSVEAVCACMTAEDWATMMASCERAKCAFPGCQHAGVDVLVERDFARHKILEVNAFGDLLPNVVNEHQTTYEAEIVDLEGARDA